MVDMLAVNHTHPEGYTEVGLTHLREHGVDLASGTPEVVNDLHSAIHFYTEAPSTRDRYRLGGPKSSSLPSWRGVLYSGHTVWSAVEEFQAVAKRAGYRYYEWNGVVYRTEGTFNSAGRVCTVEEVEAGTLDKSAQGHPEMDQVVQEIWRAWKRVPDKAEDLIFSGEWRYRAPSQTQEIEVKVGDR